MAAEFVMFARAACWLLGGPLETGSLALPAFFAFWALRFGRLFIFLFRDEYGIV